MRGSLDSPAVVKWATGPVCGTAATHRQGATPGDAFNTFSSIPCYAVVGKATIDNFFFGAGASNATRCLVTADITSNFSG